MAKDRKISVDQINSAMNLMQSNMPLDAINVKLIDGAKYVDEVETELKSILKLDEDSRLNYTKISDYVKEDDDVKSSGDIAVYVAEGDIVDGKAEQGSIGSKNMVKALRDLADNDEVKAVVLRINSPGGSALASAVILREIDLLKKKKPVVVSMGNVAASGGYYIASSGNKIYAEPNTITGSIGVFGIIPNMKNLLENKVGLSFDEVELNDHAVLGTHKSLDPAESAKIQMEVDNTYHTFKSVVTRGRHIAMDSVESIAQGRVWSGSRALSNHLIDEIGTLYDAINHAATLSKADKEDYYFVNQRKSNFEELMDDFSANAMVKYIQTQWLTSTLGDYAKYFEELEILNSVKGIQMRMMYEVNVR